MKSLLAVLLLQAALAAQQPRLPQLKLDDTSGQQRLLAEQMLKQTRSGLTGPFNAMLRSPEMSKGLMDLYLYFRYKTALPRNLVEIAILVTGREWSAPFEWYMHYPMAIAEGVSPELLAELREGRRPKTMTPEEASVYDFSTELLRTRRVTDGTYDKALKLFGETNVVDLTSLVSTYSAYAALLNVSRQPTPVAEGARALPVLPSP